MNQLMQAVEQILGDGHLNTESLAHLWAAYETAHDEETYIVELERQNRGMREAARNVLQAWDMYGTAECLRGWIDILRKEMEEANA